MVPRGRLAARRQHPDPGSAIVTRSLQPLAGLSRQPRRRGGHAAHQGSRDRASRGCAGVRSPRCCGRSSASVTTCPRTACSRSCASAALHQALVVDATGRVIGLITLEDVVAELLGGVADEFKMARRPPARPRGRGVPMIELAIITSSSCSTASSSRRSSRSSARRRRRSTRAPRREIVSPGWFSASCATRSSRTATSPRRSSASRSRASASACMASTSWPTRSTTLDSSGAPALIVSHGVASVVAVAILTYFHIVVGEMVPKSLALQQAERLACWITPPMLWTKNILYPFVVAERATNC